MRYVRRAAQEPECAALIAKGGIPPLLAGILAMRGVGDAREAQAFLHPSLEQLHDPFAMAGMDRAVEAIRRAIGDKKRIVVFGDYDVDGVTATVALLSQLRDMGADAGYYLPDRHGEGYGLNETAVKSLASSYGMMITVDCGITAVKEVAAARQAGLEVIVTDHHEPSEELPDCICLNPKLGYPFPDLCGAGVAGKLIQALGGIQALEKVLDLVAMGTVADIVPLLDENRVLASLGIKALNQRMRPGIEALAEVSTLVGKPLTAGHISFALAPRINAGGRMGHSGRSVEMLLEKDRAAAMVTARELDALNKERQRQEGQIMQEALEKIASQDLRDARCIVAAGEGWNPGVIGIVASRLTEKYYRPVFLLTREGENYTGSGRSIAGVHLFRMLDGMPDRTFIRYGGHEMAAGLTICPENIDAFRRAAQDFTGQLAAEVFVPTARYDAQAELDALDMDLVRQMELLHPTGQGNPQPVFLLRGVQASGARPMGAQGAHFRVTLSQGGRSMAASAFKMGERLGEAKGELDVLANLEEDTYGGTSQARLILRAFEAAKQAFAGALTARAGELLRCSLQSIDTQGGAKPGFRRHIALKDREHLLTVLEGMLKQGGGALVQCALPRTAAELEGALRERGLDALITCRIGPPQDDPSAPNTLCCPALGQGAALARYRQILLPDGVWSSSWIEALQKAAPDAVLYAPPVSPDVRAEVALAMPTLEEARGIYRKFRGSAAALAGCGDFAALHSALALQDCSQAKLHVALCMLRDMALLRYEADPFTIELLPPTQDKQDMEKTPTHMFFAAFAAG